MKGTSLKSLPIAVLGGDRRQMVVIEELVKMDAQVYTAGLPDIKAGQSLHPCTLPKEAVAMAKVVLLPMPGVDGEGRISSLLSTSPIYFDGQVVDALDEKVLVLVGVANSYLKGLAEGRFKLVEIADDDELAILNSVPSAEGALQMAMEELPITIHGSNSLVIGFGRVGKTMARMLGAIGSRVTVAARKASDLARVWEMGYRPINYDSLLEILPSMDIVFNTVPAIILDAQTLKYVHKEALIIDLASAPGGTDFKSAEELGIRALLAPGLPGKVAPKTAGILLARALPAIIVRELPNAVDSGGGV